MILQLNRRLGEVFGELSKTLFFEYPTLAAVAQYLAAEHGAACARWAGLDEKPVPAVAQSARPVSANRAPERHPVLASLPRRKAERRAQCMLPGAIASRSRSSG